MYVERRSQVLCPWALIVVACSSQARSYLIFATTPLDAQPGSANFLTAQSDELLRS